MSCNLGFASADFHQFIQLWGHSYVWLRDKVKYFNVFFYSKRQYGLASVWLVIAPVGLMAL